PSRQVKVPSVSRWTVAAISYPYIALRLRSDRIRSESVPLRSAVSMWGRGHRTTIHRISLYLPSVKSIRSGNFAVSCRDHLTRREPDMLIRCIRRSAVYFALVASILLLSSIARSADDKPAKPAADAKAKPDEAAMMEAYMK